MDINILFDTSSTRGAPEFYQVQQFIKDLALTLPIETEQHSSLGLATFSNGDGKSVDKIGALMTAPL